MARAKKATDNELGQKPASGVSQSFSQAEKITPENCLSLVDVLTCVKIISETIAMLPVSLIDRETKDKAADVPAYWLLKDQPNPYTTPFELKQWLIIDMLTYGAAGAIITRDKDGNATGIWQQKIKNCKPVRDPQNFDLWFNVKLDSGVPYPPVYYKDFLLFKSFNDSGVLGSSVIEKANRIFNLTACAEKMANGYFRKGVSPNLIIERDKDAPQLSDIQKTILLDDLKKFNEGADNAYQSLLLPNGYKGNIVSVDPSKSQLVETRTFDRKQVMSLFRIPQFMYGEGSGASVDEQGAYLLTFCLLPIIVNMEQRYDMQLLTDEQRKRKTFKTNTFALTRGNLTKTIDALSRAINNGIYSTNKVNEILDEPRIDEEWADNRQRNTAIQDPNHSTNAGGSNEYSEENQNNDK